MPQDVRGRSHPTCWKLGYISKADAMIVLESLRRRGLRGAHAMPEPYRCPRCQAWHLGRRLDGDLTRSLTPKGRVRERGRHFVPMED